MTATASTTAHDTHAQSNHFNVASVCGLRFCCSPKATAGVASQHVLPRFWRAIRTKRRWQAVEVHEAISRGTDCLPHVRPTKGSCKLHILQGTYLEMNMSLGKYIGKVHICTNEHVSSSGSFLSHIGACCAAKEKILAIL